MTSARAFINKNRHPQEYRERLASGTERPLRNCSQSGLPSTIDRKSGIPSQLESNSSRLLRESCVRYETLLYLENILISWHMGQVDRQDERTKTTPTTNRTSQQ